jgi:hypothetical protein
LCKGGIVTKRRRYNYYKDTDPHYRSPCSPHSLLKGHSDNLEKDNIHDVRAKNEIKIANMQKEIEEKYTANPAAAWADLKRACATCATPGAAFTELVRACGQHQ